MAKICSLQEYGARSERVTVRTKAMRSVFGLLLLLVSYCATAPGAVPCDANGDGKIDASDLTIVVAQVLGSAACTTGDLNHDGGCDVTDVQLVVNAILGRGCFAARVIQVAQPFSCTVTTTGPGMLAFWRDVGTGKGLVSFQPDGWSNLGQSPPSAVTTDGRCTVVSLSTVMFQQPSNIEFLWWLFDVR